MAFEHRADHIIRTARSRSGNKNYSRNQGVQQRDFVQFLNDAQARIYNLILQTRSSLYQKQAFGDTTANSPYVQLPDEDIYLGHNVVAALYSHNGNPINYSPLELRTVRQEVSVAGYPNSYFLLDDQLVLSPYPSSGVQRAVKLTYQKIIPSLDIRRATIEDTDINLGVYKLLLTAGTFLDESVDDLTGGWVDYVTAVDRDGTVTLAGMRAISYDTATRYLTVELPATMTNQEFNDATIDNYLVFGKNATTNSQLPEICERYLTEYTVMRAQMGDGNKESVDTSPILMAIEKEIVDAIEELEEDIYTIPIVDRSMMNYADDL